jgi:hypothetical protein
MSGGFRNIDPPPPHRPASVYPTAFGAGGGHTRWWRGGGVSLFWKTPDTALESVLYICKYFVVSTEKNAKQTYENMFGIIFQKRKQQNKQKTNRNNQKAYQKKKVQPK